MTQLRPLLPLLVALLLPLSGCELLHLKSSSTAEAPAKDAKAGEASTSAGASDKAAPAEGTGTTPETASATAAPAETASPTPPAGDAAAPAATETAPTTPAPAEATPAPAESAPEAAATPAVPADDMLDAVLWMQKSVEYEGATTTAFELAKLRLDQALKDKKWTAAPEEQKGEFSKLPPAIICDIDETLLDNSAYQAWNITSNTPFSNQTWSTFVQSKTSKAVPGSLDFTKYAISRNVKVFYVSNRTEDGEEATRENMEKLGFPMGAGNVDTFLMQNEQEDWGSKKGTRRAFIAKHYRILLMIGDNFGDFVDAYKGTEADRHKVYDKNLKHWGHDWIVLPNPSYGSFEAVPYGFNYGASPEEMREGKRKALESWSGQ